jgi:pilus assembly protein Flp/PilA
MRLLLAAKYRALDVYKKLVRKEEGAALVEYALLVGLIAVVCIAAITLLGTNISALFNRIAGKLTGLGT